MPPYVLLLKSEDRPPRNEEKRFLTEDDLLAKAALVEGIIIKISNGTSTADNMVIDFFSMGFAVVSCLLLLCIAGYIDCAGRSRSRSRQQ
jgi:hypothetical protein